MLWTEMEMEMEEDLDPTLMVVVNSLIFFAYKTLVKMKSFVGGQHGYQKPTIQIPKCDSSMLELVIVFEYVYLEV